MGDVEPVKAGSVVKDLRMVIGLGEITGGGVAEPPVCCQRSRTELCRLPGEVSVRSGVGEPSGEVTSLPTMFFTNPRPFSRLRLGVGCFSDGGLRNAGDALCEGGI